MGLRRRGRNRVTRCRLPTMPVTTAACGASVMMLLVVLFHCVLSPPLEEEEHSFLQRARIQGRSHLLVWRHASWFFFSFFLYDFCFSWSSFLIFYFWRHCHWIYVVANKTKTLKKCSISNFSYPAIIYFISFEKGNIAFDISCEKVPDLDNKRTPFARLLKHINLWGCVKLVRAIKGNNGFISEEVQV